MRAPRPRKAPRPAPPAARGAASRSRARSSFARTRAELVRLLQLAVEAALKVFGHQRALGGVALVDEGETKRQRRVLEDLDVLRPGDDGARRHQRRQVARRKAFAR